MAGATRDASVLFSGYGVRVDNGSAVSIHFDPALATGLRHLSPGGPMAVSDSKVILTALAVTADEDAANTAGGKKTKPHPFLLFFDRKGNFLYSSALDLDFTVRGLGVFESGDLLAIGVPTATDGNRHWEVIDEHGRPLRSLQPSIEGDESRKVGDRQAYAGELNTLTGQPELMPYRGHILILEKNTDYPIEDLNEGGVVRAVKLKLPPGENLGVFIGSDGANWKITVGHTETESSQYGHPRSSFRTDKIAEFDPETGDLLRYINTGKSHDPLALSCEHGGVFTALSEDPDSQALRVETATTRP
jgi:hypothetical protein